MALLFFHLAGYYVDPFGETPAFAWQRGVGLWPAYASIGWSFVMWTFFKVSKRDPHDLDAREREAQAAMELGDVERASEVLDALCDESRRLPLTHASLLANRATAFFRSGDAASAAHLYQDVLLFSGWRDALGPEAGAALTRAAGLAWAALGDVEKARIFQELAGELRKGAHGGEMLLLDAVIALRAGGSEEALALIVRDGDRSEMAMTVPALKVLRVFHAFALAQARGDDAKAEVASLLASTAPMHSSLLAGYVATWPELAAFLGA